MRRQTPIAHILYNYLYPDPTANDPPSFSAHLARNLVPEVRIEVATFYGDLKSIEARYPGLNYCYPPHRMRLGRFKHHKRLFDAFDTLGLTYNEIQDFCCWEGTRWARERYEKDEGIRVIDTTGDDIPRFVDSGEPRDVVMMDERRRQSITRKTDISILVGPARAAAATMPPALAEEAEADTDMIDDDDDDDNDDDVEDGAETETETEREPPAEAAAREQHVAELRRRARRSITQRLMAEWEQGYHNLTPEMEQLIKEQAEQGMSEFGVRRWMATIRRMAASHNRTAAATTTTITSSSPSPSSLAPTSTPRAAA